MNMRNSVFVVLMVVTAVVAGVVGYVVVPFLRHGVSRYEANVYVGESVGGVYTEVSGGNVITDIGEHYIRTVLSTASTNNATRYVTVSNDASPVASWTQLAGEASTVGCGRVAGNVTEWAGSDDGYNVTAKFDISGDITLQCAGLSWSAQAGSDNNLFACASFTQTTFASGDFLTITWVVTVDAN